MNATVPGLAIIRAPGARESYAVIHEASGIPAVLECAGMGSAEGAMLAIADLVDWTADAEDIVIAMSADPAIVTALQRAACMWGAATIAGEKATAA
jgi:hypothetical protein